MSGGLVDKVYIGLDNAPTAFDIKSRILGPNGTNLEYIRSETGVVAVLKGDKFEPLHLVLHHARSDAIAAAKSLALNLVETIKAELVQWSAAQAAATAPPALNIPPPSLVTTSTQPTIPQPAPVTMTAPSSLTSSTQQTVMPPVVSVAPASTPLMTVRQPTVLQLLPPQQQYVLNQESGQLIPIVQPGVQVSNPISSLPLAQSLPLQQPNFGTQYVDISSMQPVNVTQLRLSGVPSSMSMLLPNGLSLAQSGVNTSDSTTVSTATATPVVCAAQGTNASQKIYYSTDKAGDKTDVKYQIQGADTVQWTMPGSQTMLIPYQQLQDLSANQAGLANIQNQQFVSIAPAAGIPQTSLPLTAAQLQQLQAGTIMHLNQKPITCSGSLINIISTGQASSPHIISSAATPTKGVNSHDQRGQKRMSDGTPSQLQLRPIAPAGSHVGQDKSSRDARSVAATTVRENSVVSMGMKINPAHGTIIHVSSGQQTSLSTSGVNPEGGGGMYIRQIDRNAIQIQASKDGQKDATKLQAAAQNVQMITVPQGMTVLQNPLNIGQMPMLGQHNSQVYMIPANQPNLVQGGLPHGLIGQQVLQPGQNVTVMQPNQLGVPNSVQYNVPFMPMNMQPNAQYVSTGINLNTPLSAQQLNAALAGQQLTNQNLVSGAIPIVQTQTPGSPMTNTAQTLSASQPQQVQQILTQNSFITPTSQYTSLPPQYVMQPNANNTITVPANANIQYNLQQATIQNPTSTANTVAQASATNESETNANATTNQNSYITSSSQENGYQIQNNQNIQTQNMTAQNTMQNQNQTSYTNESTTAQTPDYSANQANNAQSYPANGNTQANYNVNQAATTQAATYNQSNGATPQTYTAQATNVQAQPVAQNNFSPSATPTPNQTYANVQNMAFQQSPAQQNPYPNATGQNMAAYANNQYAYNMQAAAAAAAGGARPWFRARYAAPAGSPYAAAPPAQHTPPAQHPPHAPHAPPAPYSYWQDT